MTVHTYRFVSYERHEDGAKTILDIKEIECDLDRHQKRFVKFLKESIHDPKAIMVQVELVKPHPIVGGT